jgi:hypothetical protein
MHAGKSFHPPLGRTVEVSKFFIIWHCMFVLKTGRKGQTFAKKTIEKNEVKNVLLAWLVKVLYSTFYTEY